MNALFKSNIQSELQTEILMDYGVNVARVSELSELLASFSVANTYSNKTNPAYKLPSFLFGFVLFLTAAAQAVAVLFKVVLKLISVILEIAPRGILFLLSLINVVIFRYSLSRAEWLMKVNDEDSNSLFWTNDSDPLPLYVQQNFNLYEL